MRVKWVSEKTALTCNIQKLRSWHLVPSLHGKQLGKKWKQWQTIFLGSKITADGVRSHEIKRCLLLGRKDMTNLGSILKSRLSLCQQRSSKSKLLFSSSHVRMWELDHKEGWALKKCWFQTVVLEKFLEGPLGGKDIKPVNSKGNQPWIFIGRTDAEAEAPIMWSHMMQRADSLERFWEIFPWCWEILRTRGEVSDRGWDGWMASLTQWTWMWQTLGDSEWLGSLACCSPWDRKVRHNLKTE